MPDDLTVGVGKLLLKALTHVPPTPIYDPAVDTEEPALVRRTARRLLTREAPGPMPPADDRSLTVFRRDRNAALRSLDAATIRAFAERYGVPLPASEDAFWPGVHKARAACTDLTAAERRGSRDWLAQRGYRPGI